MAFRPKPPEDPFVQDLRKYPDSDESVGEEGDTTSPVGEIDTSGGGNAKGETRGDKEDKRVGDSKGRASLEGLSVIAGRGISSNVVVEKGLEA